MITRYEQFLKEGLNTRNALIGAGVALAIGTGIYNSKFDDHAISKEINISDNKLSNKIKSYDVIVQMTTFELCISDESIFSYKYTIKQGKNNITKYGVTIPKDVKKFYYKNLAQNIFDETRFYVSINSFEGSTEVNLSDMILGEETSTYKIFTNNIFKGSDFDYVIIDKGHKEGEEFDIENQIGVYVCDFIDYEYYLFTMKSLGAGNLGGAGASEKY